MPKIIKILVMVVGAVVALFIIAAIVLAILFDPNEYKDEIVQAVKEHTGRDLKIDGKIGLSLFPWLGAEFGRLELSNAPGFGKQPFAQIDSAGVKVELLPLLRKQINVDTVFLDGLKLNLAKAKTGKTNWDDLVAGAEAPTPEPAAPEEAAGAPAIAGFAVKKVAIRNADVLWQDRQAGTSLTVQNLELTTGTIELGKPVDVALAFDFESGEPPLATRVDLTTRVDLDLDKQTLALPNLSLAMLGMKLNANIQGKQIIDAPVFSGKVDIAPFNLRGLMQKLRIEYQTTDSSVLNKVGIASTFSASTNHVALKDVNVTLDDSTLAGAFSLHDFSTPAYRFDLSVDQIDADRYMPPAAADAAAGTAPAETAPVELPLAMLRALDVNGKFGIKKLKVMNIRSSDVVVKIAAKNGVITLGPNQAKLYDGSYQGSTTLDVRGKTPEISLNESLSSVQLEPMLKDAMDFTKFSGNANLRAKLSARGFDAQQITKTLNGTTNFAIKNGTVKGMDVKKFFDTAEQAIKQPSIQKIQELKPKPSEQTTFSKLSGSAIIRNGIVRNEDLVIQSQGLLDITGKGSADLPNETLDYGIYKRSIVVRIKGPFASPRFSLDLSAIAKERLKQKVEEEKQKLKQKLEQKKQEEKQKLEKKLEEKLKGKLKGLFK